MWPFVFAGVVGPLIVGTLDLVVLFAMNGGRGGPAELWGMFSEAWLGYGYFGALISLPAALIVGFPLYLVGKRLGVASPATIVVSAGGLGAGLLWWADQGTTRTILVGAVAGMLTGAMLVLILRRQERREALP